jgi:alkylation response protein AidB-like acyl-CoA dehydrogenase
MRWRAPLSDLRFVLHDHLRASETLRALTGWEDLDRDTMDRVLDEAARVAEKDLQPLNRPGDEHGCVFERGAVRTPPGFKEAFRRFADAGWCGLTADPEYGGQGVPQALGTAVLELWGSANLSFSDYALLVSSAAETIARYASPELKALYIPRMVAGEWAGTMCMTEPHCGTDLGLLKTRAEPQGDGGYRITGTKIFISGGEHDLTPNIVHLVLARIAGAPAGTRGISLFLVPKFLPWADGGLGERNAVRAIGIEHKMGYAASATCVMEFEGAKGWLLGEAHRGLIHMFTMVNTARLAVGLQGLSLAEAAYQGAASYARERLQGRSPKGALVPDKPADPLMAQPDVRRVLLSARAFTEAARAVALECALDLDIATRHGDGAVRARAGERAALLTPAIKAGFSDLGFETCVACMQIWGGHGYIRANGMEQYVRDVRIAQIQEGANAIQALDLFGRKMIKDGGKAFHALMDEMAEFAAGPSRAPALAEFAQPLAKAVADVRELARWINGQGDRHTLGSAGVDAMRAFVLTLLAWTWARLVETAERTGTPELRLAKRTVARHFYARLLPLAAGHVQAAKAEAGVLMALAEEAV